MKKLLIIFLLLPVLLHAQTHVIDSLKHALRSQENPVKRSKTYIDLALVLSRSDASASKTYIDSAYKYYRIKPADSLLMYISELYADHFTDAGNPDTTFKYAATAIQLATKLNRSDIKARTLNLVGNSWLFKRNFKNAQAAYLDALRIYETANNQLAIGNLYINMGYLFQQQGMVAEAIKQYDKSAAIFKKLNKNEQLAQLYNNYGILYGENNQLAKSEQYFEASTRIRETLSDQAALANSFMNVGGISVLLKKFGKARVYLLKSKALFEKMGNTQGINSCLTNLGDLEDETKNYPQAIAYYKQSIALARTNHNMEDLENSLLGISKLYPKIGDYKTAYTYNEELLTLKDSVYKKSLTKQIAEMNTKYETEKKESQIGLLSKENIIQKLSIDKKNSTIFIIIAIFLISLTLGFLYYSSYKSRQKAILQAEVIHQQSLAAKSIIEAEERERKRIAGDLHDGVGQLFTTVKMNMEILLERFLIKQPEADLLAEKTLAMVDESCTEVRSIAHQMMPNALIKAGLVSALRDFINKIPADKLKISVETKGLNDRLESSTETVLYRVIQESVNNVIKHADATLLDILLLCDKEEITVSIEDNGKGFDSTDKSKFTGIGLKNMMSRVEYLKGSVDISSAPGKGTLVAIYIPLS